MSPWYIRNYVDSGKLFLTSESGYYLKNNYQVLIQRGRMGLTEQEAIKISDDKHLHQLLYFYIQKKFFKNNLLSNNFSSILVNIPHCSPRLWRKFANCGFTALQTLPETQVSILT